MDECRRSSPHHRSRTECGAAGRDVPARRRRLRLSPKGSARNAGAIEVNRRRKHVKSDSVDDDDVTLRVTALRANNSW
jgi:hypothetical protein